MKMTEASQALAKGKRFRVNPETIDPNLFLETREDSRQEKTRQIILEALMEANNNPKYSKSFTTIVPEKDWIEKTIFELVLLCNKFNGHNANWIEQSLEWAQKLCTGTSWDELCNTPDTSDWYRIVSWKYGCVRIVGGSKANRSYSSASDVIGCDFRPNDIMCDAVPLIVVYD